MSQGREPVEDNRYDEQGPGTHDAIPRPPIRGVRPPDDATPFDPGTVAERSDDDPATSADAVDPWGAQEPDAFAARDEIDPDAADGPPATPTRGGGILTIPLLCIGVTVIACVTLLPMADENHKLAWEREKLRVDLAHIKEQSRVNDEFLQRVADDPTLAERLANRQMKYIREGTSVLQLKGSGKEEMSPFHLVTVPPPPPMAPYQPVGGPIAHIVRQPRAQLYLVGGALLLIAMGLVLGYVPKTPHADADPAPSAA
jgi:hypothetical protein